MSAQVCTCKRRDACNGSPQQDASHRDGARFHACRGAHLHAVGDAHDRQGTSNSDLDDGLAPAQRNGTHHALRRRNVPRHKDEVHGPSTPNSPTQSEHPGGVRSHVQALSYVAPHVSERTRRESPRGRHDTQLQSFQHRSCFVKASRRTFGFAEADSSFRSSASLTFRASLFKRVRPRVPYFFELQVES